MKVFYSRVSTDDGTQNPERQLQQLGGFDYVFTDRCSGTIPLYERPKGGQVKKLLDDNKLTHLEIHSIDRLGRSTLDVLGVWEDLTKRGITIICRNPNLRNIDEQGKVDKFSELMMSILSTMSTFERNLIRERQMEGIKLRKEKKLYPGRQVGTKDTPQRLLNKDKSKQIIKYLDKGYTVREIAKIIPCSKTTVVKVRKAKSVLEGTPI
jgi:DNA invertase Pin-like site-specific DNA recombinase